MYKKALKRVFNCEKSRKTVLSAAFLKLDGAQVAPACSGVAASKSAASVVSQAKVLDVFTDFQDF